MDDLKIILKESDLKNLLVFLDRVDYKGFKEIEAINLLSNVIRNAQPVESDTKENSN